MDNEIRLKAMSIEPARAFNADLDQACCTGDFKAGNSAFITNAMQSAAETPSALAATGELEPPTSALRRLGLLQ